MKRTIIIYEKQNGEQPVKEFLLSLPSKHKAKAVWEINLLSEYGTNLREPYSKALTGDYCKGLWELRVKFASDISRIFYFMPIGNTFVLLHGFIKKTTGIPKREIETAKRYMADYKRRFEKNG
jgi:phage-related protein